MTAAVATRAPRIPAPRNSLAFIFAKLNRTDLDAIATAAIDEMDRRDPDADLEMAGDEADGSCGEDEFMHHSENWKAEPGCPLSDPGGEPDRLKMLPVYDVDQSTGPLNEMAAVREWHMDLRS